MPFDFGDILGVLGDGAFQFGDLDWPHTGRSDRPTAPIVDGKRVVQYATAWKVVAWMLAIAGTGVTALLTWGQPLSVFLPATPGVAALLGWIALDLSTRRLRFDSRCVYERRLFRSERTHEWDTLIQAAASELGGGRLHFSTGNSVRVSSHLVGAWLLMEAGRRVLRSTGVEPSMPTRNRWKRPR